MPHKHTQTPAVSLPTEELKPEDTTLIALIAQGQTEALDRLYDRYNRLVFSVALAVVAERAVAEEVTLDVFVQVWRRAGTYRPEQAKVRTWLIAITRHHAIDILRSQKSRPEANTLDWDEISSPEGPAPHGLEESVQLSLQRAHIQAKMAELPADQREALVLAYFKGYTHSEIAKALGQPLGTIKTRIRLGMQKLKKLLEEEHPVSDKSESRRDA
jgi:RNA polymerase sigma-70 factor (ECF subfamily)